MRLLFLTTALAVLTIAPAHAQSAEGEVIVVTATRRPTPALRLPADIDVINAEQSLARGRPTLADALVDVPGLDVVRAGGLGQQTSLFAGGGNSNHTLVLFDGLRVNDPSTPGSSFDAGQDGLGGLSRIEIVQGPMSAVFGSDAIGGVVNLIPRHGGEGAFNARFDATTGSFETLLGAVGADGTLGAFRYAVTAEGFATAGYDLVPERMSTRTGDEDGANASAVTGVFDWSLNHVFALDLLVRERRASADFDPFLYDASFNEYRGDDADLEISQNDLRLARLGATWTISSTLSLRATGGALRQQREQSDNGVATEFFQGDRRFADLTLNWDAGDLGAVRDVGVTVGALNETEEVDIAQSFGFPPPSVFVADSQGHIGAFGTAQGEIGALTLTAALRADDYAGFGAATTWRAGASFNLSENARLYAAYGTSFRAPTLYERFVSFGDPNLEPEDARAWEIGGDLRLAAFGREDGATLGARYRVSEIDDLIDFGPSFGYENIDKAEIEIAEAQIAVRPLDWLTARLAYTHTDATDTATGAALLRRPAESWSAALEAEHGPFSAQASWRQIGARADHIYGDDGFYQGTGQTSVYGIARLSAAWEFVSGVRLFAAADNLFDEAYEPVNAFAGAPRNVTVGVRVRR